MKLRNYGSGEYYFYAMNQKKLHIFSIYFDEHIGFGLCGVDIGFSGDEDFPHDLYDVVGSEFLDERVCKKCLKAYQNNYPKNDT